MHLCNKRNACVDDALATQQQTRTETSFAPNMEEEKEETWVRSGTSCGRSSVHRKSRTKYLMLCKFCIRSAITTFLVTLLCLPGPLHPPVVDGGNPDAKRLYDDLLSNYNKLVRPVINVSEAVTVRLKLKLSQLIDVVSLKSWWCYVFGNAYT